MGAWAQGLRRVWDRFISEAHLSRIGWTVVRHLERTAWPLRGSRYEVKDAQGNVVMRTEHEALAELVVQVPEIMDPVLRPGPWLCVVTDDGVNKPIPDVQGIGVMTLQEAYELGYRDGWKGGSADMERSLGEH